MQGCVVVRVTGVISFNLANLKQDRQDPQLMSLLLGMFCAPRAAVVACASGTAGGKATLSQEVLTSKQCANKQRCEQRPQKSWARSSLLGRRHRLGATGPAMVPALAGESG